MYQILEHPPILGTTSGHVVRAENLLEWWQLQKGEGGRRQAAETGSSSTFASNWDSLLR